LCAFLARRFETSGVHKDVELVKKQLFLKAAWPELDYLFRSLIALRCSRLLMNLCYKRLS